MLLQTNDIVSSYKRNISHRTFILLNIYIELWVDKCTITFLPIWIHIQFPEMTEFIHGKNEMQLLLKNSQVALSSEVSIRMLNQEPETQLLISLQLSLCNLVQSASEFPVIC